MSELARRSKDLAPAAESGGDRSKLLSREGSFRVYYTGSSSAVPFKWEARPGTPKHPSAGPLKSSTSRPLPPLTPPPSFLSPVTPTRGLLRNRRHGHSSSGLRLVAGFVPRLILWKKSDFQRRGYSGSRPPSPRSVLSWAASSSSSSSSGSSAVSSPPASPVQSCGGSNSRRTRRGRSRFSSFSSTGTSAVYDEPETQGEKEEEDSTCSPDSRAASSTAGACSLRRSSGFSGCSPNMDAVKRAFLSVVRVSGSGGPAALGGAHKLTDSSS